MKINEYTQRLQHIQEQLNELKQDIIRDRDQAKRDYSHVALQTIDLHHLVELLPTKAYESARIVSKFRDLRTARREAKRMILFYDTTYSYITIANDKLLMASHQLKQVDKDLHPGHYVFRSKEMLDFAKTFDNIETRMSGYVDKSHFFTTPYEVDHEDKMLKTLGPSSIQEAAASQEDAGDGDLYLTRNVASSEWQAVLLLNGNPHVFSYTKLKEMHKDPLIFLARRLHTDNKVPRDHLLNYLDMFDEKLHEMPESFRAYYQAMQDENNHFLVDPSFFEKHFPPQKG